MGGKGFLQYRERLQGVAFLLSFSQFLPINEMGLNVGAGQFNRTHHQRFNRIRNIVGLVQHIRRIEVWNTAQLRIDKLIEDEEQLEWFDRTRIEIIIAILAVVEMKSSEFAELNQTSNNHLDIHVRRVMTEIDQT